MSRFLSPDWSAKVEPVPYAKLDNPQSLNLYSYVQNNPFTRTDADGHGCEIQTRGKVESRSPTDEPGSDCNYSNRYVAQQQNGDPTLPTEVLQPPPSWTEKVADFFKPSVSTALMVGTDGLGEIGEAGAALSKADQIEKLTADAKELYPKLAEKADQLHHVFQNILGERKMVNLRRFQQPITN